jgi:hypothetical protein
MMSVAATACGVTDFDISQPVPEQHVQGSPLPGPLASLFPLPLSLDLSSKIKAQDTGPIGSVTLTSLSLTITATDRPQGDSDDWSFVTHVDVYVESTKQGTTLPKVKLASVDSPGAVQDMEFQIAPGIDVKPYVDEGSQVDSDGMGTAPSDDVSYAGTGVFTVHPL